jgi:glycosyltransferase involved in cell wall biosynthesis
MVLYHQRRPGLGRFGLERAFAEVRRFLPRDIETRVAVCRYESRGFVGRVGNVLAARDQKGDVHHIAGDVHYLALGLETTRTLLTIADCVSLHRSSGIRRFLLWMLWYYLPVRKAKMVTTISEFARNELLGVAKCDPEKIRAIHCPLSASFSFVPLPRVGEKPILLQVGTGPTKNLNRVIEALRGVRCCLWIVGHLDRVHGEHLEASGIDYENFPQVTDDELVRLYARSTIVVFASTYEGFGLPIIEAQAVGRPVIVSSVASMPEVAGLPPNSSTRLISVAYAMRSKN